MFWFGWIYVNVENKKSIDYHKNKNINIRKNKFILSSSTQVF